MPNERQYINGISARHKKSDKFRRDCSFKLDATTTSKFSRKVGRFSNIYSTLSSTESPLTSVFSSCKNCMQIVALGFPILPVSKKKLQKL